MLTLLQALTSFSVDVCGTLSCHCSLRTCVTSSRTAGQKTGSEGRVCALLSTASKRPRQTPAAVQEVTPRPPASGVPFCARFDCESSGEVKGRCSFPGSMRSPRGRPRPGVGPFLRGEHEPKASSRKAPGAP